MDGPYFGLFQEVLLNTTILPYFSDLYFSVMVAFGTYKLPPMLFLAISASLLGAMFNWRLGELAARNRGKGLFTPDEEAFQKLSGVFRRYLVWLLLVSAWFPLGGELLMVLAGLAGVRLRQTMLLVLIDRSFYYAVLAGLVPGL